jgi:mannitol/fructose-specific phosphotransferase system IIA component (Ntr-type)
MAITLSDLLDEKQIALNLSPRDQPAALREIVHLLADNGKIDNPEKFLEELVAREQVRPGAVEHGVAFPHVRTDLVDQIVLGVGRSRPSIPFVEGGSANLIFVIGVPQRLVNDYLICVGIGAASQRRIYSRGAHAGKNSCAICRYFEKCSAAVAAARCIVEFDAVAGRPDRPQAGVYRRFTYLSSAADCVRDQEFFSRSPSNSQSQTWRFCPESDPPRCKRHPVLPSVALSMLARHEAGVSFEKD